MSEQELIKKGYKSIEGYDNRYWIHSELDDIYDLKRDKFIVPFEAKTSKNYKYINLRHPNGKQKHCKFHRVRAIAFIENPDPKNLTIVDHINSNSLDNRIENLRWVDFTGNCRNQKKYKNNKSGFIGVYWSKENRKWRANIRINNELKHLGYFECKVEAAKAYDKAAKRHGFENLNFPSP